MLKIYLKNGGVHVFSKEDGEYTSYHMEPGFVAVIKDKKWITVYNFDSIEYFTVD